MKKIQQRNIKKARRHKRVRAKVKGTSERPRLSVFRSNRGVFAQLVDDVAGKTLVSAGMEKGGAKKKKGTKTELAHDAGVALAKKALEKKIAKAVFDRGGYRYHGIVKAVADGARKEGLKF